MSDFYIAVVERNSEGRFFAHIPDLPGVTAAGATPREALSLVAEFANDHVRDLVEDGAEVPSARDLNEVERDPEVVEFTRALVPIEVPGKSVKISLSIDAALLARVDRAAEKVGVSRSGYFAEALTQRLRHEVRGGGITAGGEAVRSALDYAVVAYSAIHGPRFNVGDVDTDVLPIVLTQDSRGHLVAGLRVPVARKAKAKEVSTEE